MEVNISAAFLYSPLSIKAFASKYAASLRQYAALLLLFEYPGILSNKIAAFV